MATTILTVDTLGELLEKRTEINSDLAYRWRWNGVIKPDSLLNSWNTWRRDAKTRKSRNGLGFALFCVGVFSFFGSCGSAFLAGHETTPLIGLMLVTISLMVGGLLISSANNGLSRSGEGARQIVLGFVKDMNAFARAFGVPYNELAIVSIQEISRMITAELVSLARRIKEAQATELYPSLSTDLMGLFDDLHKLFARFSLVEPKEYYFNLAKKDPVKSVPA